MRHPTRSSVSLIELVRNTTMALRSGNRLTVDRKTVRSPLAPECIAACLRGDQRAWDEVIDRYGRLVYSIARRYGLDDSDSDDVFQSVFLILYRRLETLEDTTRLSAWLITTTHRECWRVGKRSGGHPSLDEQIADVNAPSETQITEWEQQHLVRLGLLELGGQCEELLRALFVERGSGDYDTIAERLGMKVGSIGPTRARCFAKLKRILIRLGLDPGTETTGQDAP